MVSDTDFNLGCRVLLPGSAWRIRLRDLDTGNVLFQTESRGSFVNSTKRYYLHIGIEVWSGDQPVFVHEYDAAGRDVLVQLPVGTLGDSMGLFPYAARFAKCTAAG